jgi:hypothetical protein
LAGLAAKNIKEWRHVSVIEWHPKERFWGESDQLLEETKRATHAIQHEVFLYSIGDFPRREYVSIYFQDYVNIYLALSGWTYHIHKYIRTYVQAQCMKG